MNAPVVLTPGQLLGRYELLIPIAQGGMGTVWAARVHGHPAGAKIVALKTMLPAYSNDPRFERMFLAESRIASRIDHPNVCSILDQGEHDGTLYFVMEWIDGDALAALFGGSTRQAGEPLPYPVAIRMCIDAARGLHAAHELRDTGGALIGVVHRDVSPHNILVTRDGAVKIADFGVAKAMSLTDNPTTNTGQMKGKIHFMAPEQICGDPVDRRTDVFALGIVLHQLTTGVHPFTASNDLATMARITRPDPIDPPSALVPGFPADLEAVIVRALAKSPDERFASMADFAAALEAVEARLGGRREAVVAFIRAALADRTALRTARIQDALRAADRTQRMPSRAPPPDPRQRGRRFASAAALVAGGALLGAASLVWLGSGATSDPGEARAGAGRDSAFAGPSAAPAPPQAPDRPDPAAFLPPPAPAPSAVAPPTGVPAPPAASSAADRPAPSGRPAPPGGTTSGRAKFREPGF